MDGLHGDKGLVGVQLGEVVGHELLGIVSRIVFFKRRYTGRLADETHRLDMVLELPRLSLVSNPPLVVPGRASFPLRRFVFGGIRCD